MTLAYVIGSGSGEIDDLIARVVEELEADGLRLAGTVRARAADPAAHPCDMDLRILPGGPEFRISLPLGGGARGCRLDGSVIEDIASVVEIRLEGADLLVVNKFGKQEVRGRGLRPAIIIATEIGIPALVGVNEANLSAFAAFTTGMAVRLQPEVGAICAWFYEVRTPRVLATVSNVSLCDQTEFMDIPTQDAFLH